MKIIDLLNMIERKEIRDKQKFRVTFKNELTRNIYYDASEGCYIRCFRHCSDDYCWEDNYDLDDKVEILEDEEEIDIQNIEELPKIIYISLNESDVRTEFNNIIDNQNAILNAIKQLDNKLKEK